jgi:hypothetical protein
MDSTAEVATPNTKVLRKEYWVFFFWMVVFKASSDAVEAIFTHYELAAWLRVMVALVPVLPFAIVARLHWRAVLRGDELTRHIARETHVIALYALLAVFIAVDLLKAGGLLSNFVWKTKSLFLAMVYTVGGAHAWTQWRYR